MEAFLEVILIAQDCFDADILSRDEVEDANAKAQHRRVIFERSPCIWPCIWPRSGPKALHRANAFMSLILIPSPALTKDMRLDHWKTF